MPLRPYDQDRMFLLPPSLNECVRADHPARVLSEIIDRIERIEALIKKAHELGKEDESRE